MRLLKYVVITTLLAFPAIPAVAQTAPQLATVVATCGTPPSTYVAGQQRPVTQNTSGQVCTGAAASGSTTANQGTPNAAGANSWPVQGATASASANAGNPQKVGSVYMTTPPTYTNGQVGDLQMGSRGSLGVTIFGQDSVNSAAVSANSLGSEGLTNSINALTTRSALSIFNGATWDRQFTCPNTAAVSVTAGSTTQVVALSGTTIIRVCSVTLGISLAGTVNVVTGTGTNCATPTTISNPIPLTTSQLWQQTAPSGGSLFRSTAGGEICVAAATGNVTGFISYAQY